MSFKETSNHEFYYEGRNGSIERLVTYSSSGYGKITLGSCTVSCPKSIIGKRVRIKLEILL